MAALELGGGTDNDMESIRVSWGCSVQLWQFSWGGWRYTLPEGDYNATEIAATGVETNAVSAMIITQTDFAPRPIVTEAKVRVVAELPQARTFTSKILPESLDYVTMVHPAERHDMQVLPVLPEWGMERSDLQALRLDGFGDASQVDVIVHCPNDCSGNAVACDTTWGHCTCAPGFYRDDCGLRDCPEDCNGRGQCNHQTGQCTCDPRYRGLACEEIRCTMDCSGPHNLGQCDFSTGRCACAPPSYGETCELLQCPGNCTAPAGGRCDTSSGQCQCEPDRLFADCSGKKCGDDVTTVTILATANSSAIGICSIPHDDDAALRAALRMDFTCETAFGNGLCASPTVQEHCTCSCKPTDDLRPCHYGSLTDYEGDVDVTDSGVHCAPWEGRDGIADDVRSCRLPATSGAATPWCYTAPRDSPVQLRGDFPEAASELCLTYDRYHTGSLAATELPIAWAPCQNLAADPLMWVNAPDQDLASQLWALDGDRGTAELWYSRAAPAPTNTTGPLLVLNEAGYGATRRHLVPIAMPARHDADASAPHAVRRLRMELAPTTIVWGDEGCHGHGICDVGSGACRCFRGFGGQDCDIEVNECVSRPCQNGGVCTEGLRAGTYACMCTVDTAGGDCERWVTVVATVSLEGDLAAVGAEGSPERIEFEGAVATDLAAMLGVARSRIVIDSVVAGSLIVGFSVRADDTGNPVESVALRDVLGADDATLAGFPVQEVAVIRDADADQSARSYNDASNATSDIHGNGAGGDVELLGSESGSASGSGSWGSSSSWGD